MHSMQPSMSTCYLWKTDPHSAVRCFAEHGWQTLELHYTHGSALLETGHPDVVGHRFRQFAADHGICFSQGHFYAASIGRDSGGPRWYDVAPADDGAFSDAMDDMHRWIDLFEALGVKAGVLHIGGFTLREQGWEDERIRARRLEALNHIAEYAEGGQTIVCVENLPFPGSGVETTAEVIGIVSSINRDNVAVCLDTGHAHAAGVDNREFILATGPKLKALHINDNSGSSDDHVLPYGKGTIRWDEVLQALHAIEYGGPFNFEVPGETRCPKPIQMVKLDYALRVAEWMIGSEG